MHVDGVELAPGRRIARHADGREYRLAHHAERRALVGRDLLVEEALLDLVVVLALDERDQMHRARRVDIDDVARLIEGEPAPIRAASREGIKDRALLARRGVEPV